MNVFHRIVPRHDMPCDDRIELLENDQLFALFDASGPTYGGYHRPVGLDAGIDAMLLAWREATADPMAAMHKALAHANSAMLEAGEGWSERARQVIETGEGELTHATTSVTAIALAGSTWAVGHVGCSAAWLVREGYADRIAVPQTLAQQLIDEGRRADVETWHASVVTRVLGMHVAIDPMVSTMKAEPGDVIVVCSNGLWHGLPEHRLEGLIRKGARGEALLDALLEYGDPEQDRSLIVIEAP